VPTYKELSNLIQNSSWATNDAGHKGCYFSGEYTFIDGAPKVFFPAAGERYYDDGNADYRGNYGFYWSSRPGSGSAYRLILISNEASMYYHYRANGYSVRCVQE
jgi:uncharacterized protein (TIGR02145 family)